MTSRKLGMALCVVILATAMPSQGQDSDAAKKALDGKVNEAVYKTIDTGYKLYNTRDQAGCYRIYQGALSALVPILEYRPELKQAAEAALAESERLPDVSSRAIALRKGLDSLYSSTKGPRTLWTRLGGEPAVKAVVHDFVALAAGDPKVDFTRGGKFPIDAAGVVALEKQLVDLVSATTGGPLKYTGKEMKAAHKGMGITDAQFNALAGDLITVLDKYKVPQKEKDELIAIVGSTRAEIVEGPGGDAPPPPTPDAKPAETAKPEMKKDEKPLWDRLGGEPAVKAVISDFVDKAAADPKVDFTRGGKYAIDAAGVTNLKKLLVELVSANTGGPLKYEGKSMKDSHKGMGITEEQFGAIAADLIEVLKEYKVPQKEIDELIGIIATTKKDIVEAK